MHAHATAGQPRLEPLEYTQLPPAARIYSASNAFLQTQALHSAVQLGAADALADGPLPVGELAARLGAKEDCLARVLRYLAALGIFQERRPGEARCGRHLHLLAGLLAGWDSAGGQAVSCQRVWQASTLRSACCSRDQCWLDFICTQGLHTPAGPSCRAKQWACRCWQVCSAEVPACYPNRSRLLPPCACCHHACCTSCLALPRPALPCPACLARPRLACRRVFQQ